MHDTDQTGNTSKGCIEARHSTFNEDMKAFTFTIFIVAFCPAAPHDACEATIGLSMARNRNVPCSICSTAKADLLPADCLHPTKHPLLMHPSTKRFSRLLNIGLCPLSIRRLDDPNVGNEGALLPDIFDQVKGRIFGRIT